MELHQSFTNYRYQLEQTLDKLIALGTKDKELTVFLSIEDYERLNEDFLYTETTFSCYKTETVFGNSDLIEFAEIREYKFGPLTVTFDIIK